MDLNDQEELSTNFGNDYSDHFLRTGVLPQAHIQNAANPLVGYPRLQKLHELKKAHTRKHACKPFMATTSLESLPLKLHDWASNNVQFDVVLVGGCFRGNTQPGLFIKSTSRCAYSRDPASHLCGSQALPSKRQNKLLGPGVSGEAKILCF